MSKNFYIDDALAEELIKRAFLKPLYVEVDGERTYKNGAESEAARSALYSEQLRGVLGEQWRPRST